MFSNEGQDTEFIEDFLDRHPKGDFDPHFAQPWNSPVRNKDVRGDYGILFYEMLHEKKYYPNKRTAT